MKRFFFFFQYQKVWLWPSYFPVAKYREYLVNVVSFFQKKKSVEKLKP